MGYASQLYSAAQQKASQGATPVEKQRNAFLADIELARAITALGGKNYSNEADMMEDRLAEWEEAIADAVAQGEITYTTVRNAGRGAPTATDNLSSEADVSQALVENLNEKIGGTGPSPLGFSLLADAYRGARKSDVIAKADESIQDVLDDYQNAAENFANTSDFSKLTPEQQREIMDSAVYRDTQAQLQEYEQRFGELQELGLQLPVPTLTKDANGNYSSQKSSYNPNASNTGASASIRTNADGTIDIYNGNTVYQSFPSGTPMGDVLAAQNTLISGFSEAPKYPVDPTIPGGASGAGTPGGSTTPGSTPGGTTSGGTTPTDPATVPPGVDPADVEWINGLYTKYFDRNATSAELANWSKETPFGLETFLESEATKYGYTSAFFKDSKNANLAEAMKIINESNLPPELKALWGSFVTEYEGVEVDQQEILDTFAKIKSETIDPYFKGLTDLAIADVKNNFSYLDRSRETEQEIERAQAGIDIRQAKAGNEAAGMTFTGKAITDLGAESAYAQDPNTANAIPTQEPFGGMFYEGTVNQNNRLLASSSKSRYEKSIADMGVAAESSLGSGTVAGLGLGLPTAGGVEGDLKTQKDAKESETLNDLLTNYYEKQQLNTNQTLT